MHFIDIFKINSIFLFETELLLPVTVTLICCIVPSILLIWAKGKEILLTVTKRYQKKNIERREERGG